MATLSLFLALCLEAPPLAAGVATHSVARQWCETLLDAIRTDFARPTVHARNLWHVSMAMYDAWAAYDPVAETYLLGKTQNGFTTPFYGMPAPADLQAAREEAISFAAFRLLRHRFAHSPGRSKVYPEFESLMTGLGYDPDFTSTDYAGGSAAALGNYIAGNVIAYAHRDNANEQDAYRNRYYQPVNPPLAPTVPGDGGIVDLNRWQPLTLNFIDQSGNPIPTTTPPFLSPEWGQVHPFALGPGDLAIREHGGHGYWMYHDPGDPPYLDTLSVGGLSEEYKWGHSLVSIWQSQLDPTDGVMWDISPGSIGNNPPLPTSVPAYRQFYDLFGGGDQSQGHAVNPRTGQPYAPQIVPRGDYARVLAEFWADGPQSETPPGHWFTILNYVNDHPQFEHRFKGQGPVLDPLEWDVKSYFLLGGTMHDVAVAVWGIKGAYDYVRPISAIRGMCARGQSTDPQDMGYDPGGIPLVPGYVELVLPGDPLAGPASEHVGKIKLYTYRGPYYIPDPEVDFAGAGWVRGEEFWTYQRPTFITPPFAGYVSGHSTFSRAAAELMTMLTGDEFFPGGMGEFEAPAHEFLVFEDGPSIDLTLQWATYRDASDQTSLSRIWGGIHPPQDDIPGRIIGMEIAYDSFALAEAYFNGQFREPPPPVAFARAYPNPVTGSAALCTIELDRPGQDITVRIYNVQGRLEREERRSVGAERFLGVSMASLESGLYFVLIEGSGWRKSSRVAVVR